MAGHHSSRPYGEALAAPRPAAGPAGLGREVLTGGAVVRALTLPQSEWAREPETKSSLLRGESERALREVVAYRLYVDRSVTGRSRCLEQAGLLVIGSANLDAVGADEEEWPAPRWPRPRPAGRGRPVRPWPAGRRSGANGAISAQLVADQPSQRGR